MNHISIREKEIQDLRRLLSDVSQREEKYHRLFEKDLDAIIIFDADSLVIEDVNNEANILFGFSDTEFSGMSFEHLCGGERQAVSEVLELINKNDEVKKILHAHFMRKNGTGFSAAFYTSSFETVSGRKKFIAARDITEKLKIEEELNKSQEQLIQAQKMETLGTMVAGVAHEINNPINLVMNNINLLQRIWKDLKPVLAVNDKKFPNLKYGGLPYSFINENLDQMITDIDLAAKRVESIVRQLKDFSRKSSVREKSDISVNDAVENALRLAQSTLKKSQVAIQTSLAGKIPLIKGHLQSIEQVLLNLVINAIEAIGHDRGKIIIRTEFLENEKTVIIRVSDNGKGMSPETLEKIFDPFFTEKQALGGTGLGLSVSYTLIQSHEGEITCRSEPGKGTEFEIRLPLEPERKPIKVLIVDDDSTLRKLIARGLKKGGNFFVKTASNGTEALIKIGTDLPDLLILDLFMPQMNGLEVCRVISAEKKLSKMKVVIITGLPDNPKIAEIKKLGYMHIFSKPLDIKGFVKDVTSMFREVGC